VLTEKDSKISDLKLELSTRDIEVPLPHQVSRLKDKLAEKDAANRKLKAMTMSLFDEFVG